MSVSLSFVSCSRKWPNPRRGSWESLMWSQVGSQSWVTQGPTTCYGCLKWWVVLWDGVPHPWSLHQLCVRTELNWVELQDIRLTSQRMARCVEKLHIFCQIIMSMWGKEKHRSKFFLPKQRSFLKIHGKNIQRCRHKSWSVFKGIPGCFHHPGLKSLQRFLS